MGLLISADVARVLAVTLDGRELARYYVAEQVDDVEVLEELGQVLGGDRAAPDDMALDPGPLEVSLAACGHAQLPGDLAEAVQIVNDLGDEHVEGGGTRAVFFGAVEAIRAHWCTHAPAPDGPEQVDESAEDQPGTSHDEPSTQVNAPQQVDESAENRIRPSVAQPVESPAVSVKPPVTDTPPADVAVSGTPEPPRRAGPAPAASTPAKEPWRPAAVKGEAERGKATDAVVRRWARDEGLADPGARVQLPAWVRVEYERLHGGPPDFRARRVAREHGTQPTTPDVDPGVASLQTIHVWCLRNGVEDRLPPSTDAKTAYRAAWIAAHPEPPAAGSPAGEDPPTPGERAGRSPARASGRSNGHQLPADSAEVAPEPAVEPIGDGTAKRSRARPEQLERARELAAESKTPVQICDLTGVSLDEAREAVADAKKDQKR